MAGSFLMLFRARKSAGDLVDILFLNAVGLLLQRIHVQPAQAYSTFDFL